GVVSLASTHARLPTSHSQSLEVEFRPRATNSSRPITLAVFGTTRPTFGCMANSSVTVRRSSISSTKRNGSDQLIVELPPDRRTDLRDLLNRREAIELRHQRVTQAERDRQGADAPGIFPATAGLRRSPDSRIDLVYASTNTARRQSCR